MPAMHLEKQHANAIKQYGTWGFLKQRYPQIIHFNGMFHAKPSIWEYQHLWNPLHDDKKHGIELGLPWSAGLPQLFKVPKPLFSLATSPRYPLPVLDALQKIVSLLVNVDIPIKKTKDQLGLFAIHLRLTQ